jgi:precorrin-2 dehydrogenase/sirohydrochlorin ferrochelatase
MFPIFLKLEGRRCLVVGAGTIATPKIASLLRAGGMVTVVAPKAGEEARRMAGAGEIAWLEREFAESDLDGVFLVVTGTDQQAVNHRVAEAARERNILVNSVDDPPDCDFYYPSLVRRGDLQVAISTAGKSPALAQRLREEIDALLEPELGDWLDELGETRLRMLEVYGLSEERKRALHLLARRETCEPATCPVQQELNKLLIKRGDEAAEG